MRGKLRERNHNEGKFGGDEETKRRGSSSVSWRLGYGGARTGGARGVC